MKLVLPKIYPITDTALSGLSHADQVRRLIDGGASFIQLRDKTASSGEFYQAVVDALRIARSGAARIIVNDRVDIALAAGADGVHLGQDDLPAENARQILGAEAIIGVSTHSVEQAKAALKLPIDYIAIGPIFATSTKADAGPTFGLEGLNAVRSEVRDLPLVAIGGITFDNAAAVLGTGTDSLAMIRDIVSDRGQITFRMQQLLAL